MYKFERYSVIYEYFYKPKLLPPFNIISFLIIFIRFISNSIRKKQNNNNQTNNKKLHYCSKPYQKRGFGGNIYLNLEFFENEI